jgi:hypothetical protein
MSNETKIKKAILKMLINHHLVAWAFITTSGTVRAANYRMRMGRWFLGKFLGGDDKVGKDGLSDIIGQMIDGRLIAIEVKCPGEKPREDQESFLKIVAKCGGVAGWADGVDIARSIIEFGKPSL